MSQTYLSRKINYLSTKDLISLNNEFIPKYTLFKIAHRIKNFYVLKDKDSKQVYISEYHFYKSFVKCFHFEFQL